MRRVGSLGLIGFGAFLLVVAILLPTYMAGKVVQIPLDTNVQSVAEATDATVFRPKTLSEEKGVRLKAVRTVHGDVPESTNKTAVLDVFLWLKDPSGEPVTYYTDRVALDRKTAEAVRGFDENMDGKKVEHTGLTYTFPPGAEKKEYPYFDNTAKETYPIRFVSTDRIKGLEVYRYEMTVEPVKIGSQDIPGKLLGGTEPTVTADRYYKNVRTLWVEPTSGIIIRGREQQVQTFRNSAGEDKVTLLDAELTFNDDTVTANIARAKESMGKVTKLTKVFPLITGILGALFLIVGLIIRPRRETGAPKYRMRSSAEPTREMPHVR